MTPDLAVIVPTLNERGNVKALVERLERVLAGVNWEVIFVDDDSPDGTAEAVWALERQHPRVRCIKRVGRRGLASACIEGMLATSARYYAVMDADLQHDETLLTRMYRLLKQEGVDVVVASRFHSESARDGLSEGRTRISRLGISLGRIVLNTSLSDPLSGFFMLRRSVFMEALPNLSAEGFKILLDILTSINRPLKIVEVPMHFRERRSGESKLSALVMLEYIMLIADKIFGRVVPARFILFILVGASGVLVHLAALWLIFRGFEAQFQWAQAAATVTAMTTNFTLNNSITYRDRRLHGAAFLRGLLSFYVACTIGAIINVEIAGLLFGYDVPWAFAGVLGAVVGSIWNYGVTSTFTWGNRRRTRSAAKPRPAGAARLTEPTGDDSPPVALRSRGRTVTGLAGKGQDPS